MDDELENISEKPDKISTNSLKKNFKKTIIEIDTAETLDSLFTPIETDKKKFSI